MRVFILLQGYKEEGAEVAVLSFPRSLRSRVCRLLARTCREALFSGKVILTSGQPEDIVVLGALAKQVAGRLQTALNRP